MTATRVWLGDQVVVHPAPHPSRARMALEGRAGVVAAIDTNYDRPILVEFPVEENVPPERWGFDIDELEAAAP